MYFKVVSKLNCNIRIYLSEAICLGIFMVSASFFATLLEYPYSPVHQLLPDSFSRLIVMGLMMGLTAIAIIYSPVGKLSGAHMNPAVTLSFYLLRKIDVVDAAFYVFFQLLGGLFGVILMVVFLGGAFTDLPVHFVVTKPGPFENSFVFLVESVMSFMMMSVVLTISNSRIAKWTGLFAGALVFIFIVLSATVSGFSINPARTLASAIPSGDYTSIWIYLTAPLCGMLLATLVFLVWKRKAICAKMFHDHAYPCLFNCGYCQHQDIPFQQHEKIHYGN